MRLQRGLDLARIDVDAATDDHVLGAPLEVEVAALVQHAEVARIPPAVAEGFAAGLRVVPEAVGYRRAAVADAPDLAGRERPMLLVYALNLYAKHRPSDGFAEFLEILRA